MGQIQRAMERLSGDITKSKTRLILFLRKIIKDWPLSGNDSEIWGEQRGEGAQRAINGF